MCPVWRPARLPTWIQLPGSPEFAFDRQTSFTIEAIIKPDPLADAYPRAIAAARSSGLRDGEANPGEAGWALTLGSYGGIPNSLRWAVGDAAGNLVTVLAANNLADSSFHHVAGVVDRDAGTALLFVDGIEAGKAAIDTLGVVATAGDIVIGNGPAQDAPYSGLIDEVRLSRTARRRFNPVLGEGDDRYRQRLALFAPYRLPTAAALRRGVAALSLPPELGADAIVAQATQQLLGDAPAAVPGQIDILELDSTRFCANLSLRAMPLRLTPGQSIDAAGAMPADEAAATGSLYIPCRGADPGRRHCRAGIRERNRPLDAAAAGTRARGAGRTATDDRRDGAAYGRRRPRQFAGSAARAGTFARPDANKCHDRHRSRPRRRPRA